MKFERRHDEMLLMLHAAGASESRPCRRNIRSPARATQKSCSYSISALRRDDDALMSSGTGEWLVKWQVDEQRRIFQDEFRDRPHLERQGLVFCGAAHVVQFDIAAE